MPEGKRALKTRAARPGAHRHAVRPEAGRTPPGAPEEVPELLVTGLQAVEDRDFNSHHGIDVTGMVRAAFKNVAAGRAKQGASTLTQQLARSGLLGIGREQTLTRKGKEILYALLIEARYDKRTILEAYLNQVYLGQRGAQAIHGVAAGAEFWFGRDLADLSTEQIALLIGIVRGPSLYDPRRNPERALERRNFVLGEMHETGLIDDAEYQRALKAPLGVTKDPGSVAANRFPAYVDLVRRQLARDYPADALAGAGLSVMSGMSPSAQAMAEGAVARTLKSLDNKRRPPLQAGLVVTDVHNGEVRGRGRQPQRRRARLQPRGRGAAPGRFAAQAVRVPAGAGAAGQVFAGQLGRRFAGHGRAGQEARTGTRATPTAAATAPCA